MWNPTIGENAGKVWQTLKTKGQTDFNVLKKTTGLYGINLFLALGWLAREGKVKFEQKQNQSQSSKRLYAGIQGKQPRIGSDHADASDRRLGCLWRLVG